MKKWEEYLEHTYDKIRNNEEGNLHDKKKKPFPRFLFNDPPLQSPPKILEIFVATLQ